MIPNINDAEKFLQKLAGEQSITFKTIPEAGKAVGNLNVTLHGDLKTHVNQLVKLNNNGAAVFIMVNQGNGEGHKNENVKKIRALFADFDGISLPKTWGITPHIINESSSGKYHAYFLVSDCPLEKFKPTQKAIAKKLNSDPSVNNISRLMRLPGLAHQKKKPFLSRILSMSDEAPYTLQQIIDGLGLDLKPGHGASETGKSIYHENYFKGSSQGGRTSGIVKIARSLSGRDFTEDEAVLFCLTHDEKHNKPPLENTHPGKVEHTVRDIYERYVYPEVPDYVTELNEKNFITRDGGKTFVCTEDYDFQLKRYVLRYSSFTDFKNFHGGERVVVGAHKDGNPIYKALGVAWLESKYRRQYKGVIMAPQKEIPSYYNLWKGFAVDPIKGSWKRMKNHIQNIICNGDKQLFRYVMGWCARMVQIPEERGEVALVLQGGRGVGKGVFGHTLRRLLAHHAFHITNTRHLTGNFNAHLEACVFLFVDEALWAGDKAGENVLKGLITESVMPVERKFADVKQVPNVLHILMASNNDWVVPAGLDERRYCVLKVSDAKAGNYKYFNELAHEINNGGLGAMLFDLLKLDLSDFNVRDVPKTVGLFEQKLQTMEPVPSWWYQKLQDGEISSSHGWASVPVKDAYDDYLEITSKMSGQIRKVSLTAFGMAISKLLPEGWPKKKKHYNQVFPNSKRINHYELPSLDECRKYFEGILGDNVVWEEAPPDNSVIPCKYDDSL